MNLLYRWHRLCCTLGGHQWSGVTWTNGRGDHGPYYCRRCFARAVPKYNYSKGGMMGRAIIIKDGSPDGSPKGYEEECKEFGYWRSDGQHVVGCV